MEPRAVRDHGRAAVTRRQYLRVSVKLGLLAATAAFVAVFIHGMLGPGRSTEGLIRLAGIAAGGARLETRDGAPVWVVNRSERQLDALEQLSEHVFVSSAETHGDVDNPHRSLRRVFGVYRASTARSGVLVQYVQQRPDRLASTIPWFGGFVDPGSGALFDVAGRRYRTTSGAPLAVPPHRYVDEATVELGEW